MSHYSTRPTCLISLPPFPCFYLSTKGLVLQSLQISDRMIKSRSAHKAWFWNTGCRMQPDQIGLSLLQLCPCHWHPEITELMDGCLPDVLSYYKVGEKKKRRKKKEKTWDLDEAPLFLRSIHVREQKTQLTHCFRDTQPSRSAGSNSPEPARGLQRVPFCSALQIPPSLFSLSLPSHHPAMRYEAKNFISWKSLK